MPGKQAGGGGRRAARCPWRLAAGSAAVAAAGRVGTAAQGRPPGRREHPRSRRRLDPPVPGRRGRPPGPRARPRVGRRRGDGVERAGGEALPPHRAAAADRCRRRGGQPPARRSPAGGLLRPPRPLPRGRATPVRGGVFIHDRTTAPGEVGASLAEWLGFLDVAEDPGRRGEPRSTGDRGGPLGGGGRRQPRPRGGDQAADPLPAGARRRRSDVAARARAPAGGGADRRATAGRVRLAYDGPPPRRARRRRSHAGTDPSPSPGHPALPGPRRAGRPDPHVVGPHGAPRLLPLAPRRAAEQPHAPQHRRRLRAHRRRHEATHDARGRLLPARGGVPESLRARDDRGGVAVLGLGRGQAPQPRPQGALPAPSR